MKFIRKITENEFLAHWIGMLWETMARTGNGYRRPRMVGVKDNRGERRPDKLRYSKAHRMVRSHP